MKPHFRLVGIILGTLALTVSAYGQDQGTYRIKPADMLNVYVHDNIDLTMPVTVLPDGTISYPLVGNLYVQGLTTAGLQDALTERLKQFLQTPVVVVTISSQTAYKVYVVGEVGAPGAYPYEEGKRLTDYIAMAGGQTPYSNLKKCTIISKTPEQTERRINLKEIFEKNNQALNIAPQPDDTIIIARKKFILEQWNEVAQVMAVIIGAVTLYYVASRD
jgi:polysaccharide export outer membrane protein